MAEKTISVKEGKVAEKDGKDWIELVDQEDKKHRIFRSIENNEGVWVHLDKEVDMLKGKINDGSIEGLALKLTKEKKGQYWNAVSVELVKDILKQEAIKEVADTQGATKNRGTSISYAKDLAVAGLIQCSQISLAKWADFFYQYMTGGNNETTKVHQNSKDTTQPEEERQVSGQDSGEATDEKVTTENLYELVAKAKGWKSSEPVHSFLINKCKITEDRIKNDPASVWEEVKGTLEP